MRQSSMQCARVGLKGTIKNLRDGKAIHRLNGATVCIVTDRTSGLVVELIHAHAGYGCGAQVMIGENNFESTT